MARRPNEKRHRGDRDARYHTREDIAAMNARDPLRT